MRGPSILITPLLSTKWRQPWVSVVVGWRVSHTYSCLPQSNPRNRHFCALNIGYAPYTRFASSTCFAPSTRFTHSLSSFAPSTWSYTIPESFPHCPTLFHVLPLPIRIAHSLPGRYCRDCIDITDEVLTSQKAKAAEHPVRSSCRCKLLRSLPADSTASLQLLIAPISRHFRIIYWPQALF